MFIGVDPDMHNTAVAYLKIDGAWSFDLFQVGKKITGRDALLMMAKAIQPRTSLINYFSAHALAVEAQDIYQFGAGRTANPKSIMYLATVAGIALARFSEGAERVFFPPPNEWKGNVPKIIHQARILSKAGWLYERVGSQSDGYCYPTNAPHEYKKGEWKHLVDAMGLALYAKAEYERLQKGAPV